MATYRRIELVRYNCLKKICKTGSIANKLSRVILLFAHYKDSPKHRNPEHMNEKLKWKSPLSEVMFIRNWPGVFTGIFLWRYTLCSAVVEYRIFPRDLVSSVSEQTASQTNAQTYVQADCSTPPQCWGKELSQVSYTTIPPPLLFSLSFSLQLHWAISRRSSWKSSWATL